MKIRYDKPVGEHAAQCVLEKLENAGYEARLAGGCVRDSLIGNVPNDYDVATTALPAQMMEVFKDDKVIPTGLKHGTLTIIYKNSHIEVTTLRKDTNCDGRHADVEFTNDWKVDASRRDFTINAMFMDSKGIVYDFFGGVNDLKDKRIRFVGNPEDRIKEDYLRIMRYFRFSLRYGFPNGTTMDDPDFLAVAKFKDGLKKISQERITSELMKMLSYDNWFRGIRLMEYAGVLSLVLPEHVVEEWMLYPNSDTPVLDFLTYKPIARLCLLINDWDVRKASSVGRRLKLSLENIQCMKSLCRSPLTYGSEPADSLQMFDDMDKCPSLTYDDFREFWLHYGETHSRLRLQDSHERSYGLRRTKNTPILAEDLIKVGLVGKQIGDTLTILKRAFRNGEWNIREEGLLLVELTYANMDILAVALTSDKWYERELAKIGMQSGNNKN